MRTKKTVQPIVKQTKTVINSELTVKIGEHQLSPFIVNLSNNVPEPMEILDNGARINLNLLEGIIRSNGEVAKESSNSLLLNRSDISNQLKEDIFVTTKRERWTIPIIPKKLKIKRFSHISKLNEQIPQNAFAPKQTPEDIFAFFDLPENDTNSDEPENDEDNEDESELVELEGLEIQKQPKLKKHQVFSFSKAVGTFVLISFAFVLPLHAMNVVSKLYQTKSNVETVSKQAMLYLKDGATAAISKQTEDASSAFSKANEQFANARETISKLGLGTSVILSALPQKNYGAGKALINAGEQLSTAAQRFTEALTAMSEEVNPTPVSKIKLLNSYISSIVPHLSQTNSKLASINEKIIPQEEQRAFEQIKNNLPSLISSLEKFDNLSDLAIKILGGDDTKRYLLVFQNNTEIRPTGGFMGSFAEIKVRDGILEQISVPTGGTYDLQGAMRISRAAPKPLQLLNARWEFQDANWFPDFPSSARQIIEFYNDAGGPSVDGVIAINATYVADLINMLGPIDMPDYDRVIDGENFLFEAQKIVEIEYDKEINKPKQFIGDLAPLLVDKILKSEPAQFLSIIDRFGAGLTQKDIQLYFVDQDLQKETLARNWGGATLSSPKDYLMVVDTNLGGGKTDGVIEEKVDIKVDIREDGSIFNTVTVSRTHHGIQGVIFTGVNNVDYMRLYVPKGSELISAKGFSRPDSSLFEKPDNKWVEDDDLIYSFLTLSNDNNSATDVYEENGKTVFGNWVQTPPGLTSKASFTYKLPNNLLNNSSGLKDKLIKMAGLSKMDSYSITIQKQSGVINRTTDIEVSLPENMKSVWQSNNESSVSFTNLTDGFFGMLIDTKI